MKIFFPRNIEGGRLNVGFQVGPFRVTLVQLLIVAAGVAIALGLRNAMVKNEVSKVVAAILVSPIIFIFLFIAFFKLSELKLIPFIAKFVQTNILDETIKYQINTLPVDTKNIAILKAKQQTEKKSAIEEKSMDPKGYQDLQDKNIFDNRINIKNRPSTTLSIISNIFFIICSIILGCIYRFCKYYTNIHPLIAKLIYI